MYEMLFMKVIIDNNISNETWLKLIDKLDELYSKKREIYTKKATKIIRNGIGCFCDLVTLPKRKVILGCAECTKRDAPIYNIYTKISLIVPGSLNLSLITKSDSSS